MGCGVIPRRGMSRVFVRVEIGGIIKMKVDMVMFFLVVY